MADVNPNDLSWEQYRFFLTKELERTAETLEKILDKVNAIERVQIASESRSKTLGAVFGVGSAALFEFVIKVVELVTGRH